MESFSREAVDIETLAAIESARSQCRGISFGDHKLERGRYIAGGPGSLQIAAGVAPTTVERVRIGGGEPMRETWTRGAEKLKCLYVRGTKCVRRRPDAAWLVSTHCPRDLPCTAARPFRTSKARRLAPAPLSPPPPPHSLPPEVTLTPHSSSKGFTLPRNDAR